MTAEEFEQKTGHAPQDDELERANCPRAGTPGHIFCGTCKEHDLPYWSCPPCVAATLHARARPELRRAVETVMEKRSSN